MTYLLIGFIGGTLCTLLLLIVKLRSPARGLTVKKLRDYLDKLNRNKQGS